MSSGKILIVDDHDVVRRVLRSLFFSRPEWTICGEAVNGLEAIEKAKSLRPDIIVMDISMPRLNGLEATRIIRKEVPESKVVIISQNEPSIARREAEEVEAAGFIPKIELSQQLVPMIAKLLGAKETGKDAGADRKKDPPPDSPMPDWLAGGGIMGRMIRAHDWTKTPLGPIDNWPQSLKTSINLILNSQHPMWIGWGPATTFIYNDAYIQVLSLAKHPEALGKPAAEVWAEIWDICGPLADKVFQKGEASFVDEVRLLMNRGEFVEETYYSFSYSPIRDESGEVAGLFCPSTEVTPKVINARRLQTLSELSSHALVQKTVESACQSAIDILGKNPDDVPFGLLYLIDDEEKRAKLEQICGVPKGARRVAPDSVNLGEQENEECCWPIAQVSRERRTQLVSVKNLEGLPLGLAQQPLTEAIVLPVTTRGEERSAGVFIAGISPNLRLDSEYRTFYELVAGQIATAIQNARASEEEKKRLEALAEIDRAKTTFFSNVSHEFRTPLTLMLGPVEELLARSHTDLAPAAKRQLELVNRNGSRLLRLVNTLLDFSRIEAGRMQAIYQPTDLAAFTVELASVFRSATERAGLKLEIDCPKLGEPVFVDRGMWEKIVLNLLSNAFKFTFEGGIAVSLAQTAENVELRVRDTGVGIPAPEIPRLFDRFHRIENTRIRTHEGSGIGLALVQELVKLHGGSVRAESKPGQGTTFIVSVPRGMAHLPADRIGGTRTLASTAVGAAPFVEEALRWLPNAEEELEEEILPADELIPVPCPPISDGGSTTEKRPYILVADDNADMRQYLARLLAERYEVKAVADGELALASVRERSPDLVLTDVMMPNLDGFGVLNELRSNPETRTIPVIMLSARAGEESRVEGMEHGADDYLIKPFSARELLARVQTHLQMARVRKESEEALRRRTEQFESLLDQAPMGVYLIDADFRLRAANPTAVQLFGGSPNLIGRDFDELLHTIRTKAYADEIVRKFRHTLQTGEANFSPEWQVPRGKSGSFDFFEWRINRIPLPEGGYGAVCYFRDISRQVQARQTIADSEERLRLATDAAELGIWHWYPDEDRVTWENDRPYEIFSRTRQEGPINGAEFKARFCHPDDVESFEKTVSHSLETGSRFFFPCRIRRPDGSYGWVEFTAQVEYRNDGLPLRLLGTVLDVTERKQAEETLRQSEERLRLAQKVGHSGTWESNFATGELISSPELREVFGLTESANKGSEPWRNLIHPDDLAYVDKMLARAVETHSEYHVEFRIKRPDGAERWIEATAQIFYSENDKPLRVIGVSTDVTERKQAEHTLRQQRQRFDLVAEASQVGFWFCDLPFDKLVWDANVKEHFWLPPDAEVTINTFYERIHPDDRERTRQAIADSNANDEPYDIEYRTLSPDGRQKWIRAMGRTFYDAKGNPKSFDGLTLDNTERKRAEERERQITAESVAATAKFRAVFEQTPVFAGIMAVDGTIIDANQLCLDACGYTAEQVLGKLFWETPWWRHSEEVQSKIKSATFQAAQGKPFRETLSYHWADGTERLVDFAVHPIFDDAGNILFLHPTGVDITDLKRAEENYRILAETLDAEVQLRTKELEQRNVEVVQQSEQLRDLSSRLLQAQDAERRHIARELHDSAGQTLAALGMILSQLSEVSPGDTALVTSCAEECQRLVSHLSQEIRTTSYLLHPPMLDEIGLPDALSWYIKGLAERSGLDISLNVPKDFGRLSREMELVMFRLVQESLTNIHRHSGSKSAVIRLACRDESVVLDIQDEGRGITPERLAQIQAQSSGVGIRGMRERVRQLEGQMNIESNGKGTKISFEFPLRKSPNLKNENAEQLEATG